MFRFSTAARSTITGLRTLRRLIYHGRGGRGRKKEAIQAARRAIALAPNNPNCHHDLGDLLFYNGNLQQAEAAQRQAIALDPNHLGGNIGLLRILWQKDEPDEFRAVLAVARDAKMPTLPETLQIGLGPFPASDPTPAVQLSGDSPPTFSTPNLNTAPPRTLEQRQLWAQQANVLLANWILFNHDKLQEIDEISVYPNFADALTNGGGAMLIGAHLGPRVAGYHVARAIPDSKIISDSSWSFFHLPRSKALIPRAQNPKLFLVQAMQALRQGNVVFWAGDTNAAADGPPTLAYHARVPIFWYAPLWQDGKIVHHLRRGPSPTRGENLDQWLRRWFGFYGQTYLDAVSADPENIRRDGKYKNILHICDRAGLPTDRIREYLP